MGVFDVFGKKSNKKLESAQKQVATLRNTISKFEGQLNLLQLENADLIDKTYAFFDHLKQLVGTLQSEQVVDRCWALLNQALGIKKGGIFKKAGTSFVTEISIGFKDSPPEIPEDEESMITFAIQHGSALSIARIREQDDLAYLERRGIIPDAKLVCPARIQGEVQLVLVVCNYAGNVFRSEDDLEVIQMVGTLLGLVMSNAKIIAEQRAMVNQQKAIVDEQKLELLKVRNLFSTMVAPEIIEHIEQNPNGIMLGGEKQKIAILFVDIRNFTSLSESHSPEIIIKLLNNFFSIITDVVIANQGTLDKFMGDAALALFGTPVKHSNPSLSAANTALQIQKQLEIKSGLWLSQGLPPFGAGIGVNFQEVIVGNVGSERLSNFTAIGDGVNLAFRLCGVAKAGQTLISDSCRAEIASFKRFRFAQQPEMSLKGKAKLIQPFLLTVQANKIICESCNAEIEPLKKFCGQCGFRIAQN